LLERRIHQRWLRRQVQWSERRARDESTNRLLVKFPELVRRAEDRGLLRSYHQPDPPKLVRQVNTGANGHVTRELGNALGKSLTCDLPRAHQTSRSAHQVWPLWPSQHSPQGSRSIRHRLDRLRRDEPSPCVPTSVTPVATRWAFTTAGLHTLEAWIAGGASDSNAVVPPPTAPPESAPGLTSISPAHKPSERPPTPAQAAHLSVHRDAGRRTRDRRSPLGWR